MLLLTYWCSVLRRCEDIILVSHDLKQMRLSCLFSFSWFFIGVLLLNNRLFY